MLSRWPHARKKPKDGGRRGKVGEWRGGKDLCSARARTREAPKILADIEIPEMRGSNISISRDPDKTCFDPGNPIQKRRSSIHQGKS